MKSKISYVEIFVLFIIFVSLGFYLVPKMMISLEQKQYGRMQTNAAMMTSKVLSYFSDNNNKLTPTEIAKKMSDEMNKLCKNPIDKKNPAYSFKTECLGCVVLTPDDKLKSIILTAKDKEGNLIARTVIQPPSFVTYLKELK